MARLAETVVMLVIGWVAVGVCFLTAVRLFPGVQRDVAPPTVVPPNARVVLIVTAHPDDEAMFFGPTLTALREHGTVDVHILCLSTGDYEGLGKVRVQELVVSCELLGIASHRVTVIDDVSMRDGPDNSWPPGLVARHVGVAIATSGAQVVLTFDSVGVSGHPNHVAAGLGVELAIAESGRDVSARCAVLTPSTIHITTTTINNCHHHACYRQPLLFANVRPHHRLPQTPPPDTPSTHVPYCVPQQPPLPPPPLEYHNHDSYFSNGIAHPPRYLETTSLLRKYIGPLDVLNASLVGRPAFVASADGVQRVRRAMRAHASQFVWFRRLFVMFSAYTHVNTFNPRRVSR